MTDSSQAVQPVPGAAEDDRADRMPSRLLPGVRLGELDSGASQQAYLLTLPDGRNFQVAGALYHLASLLDGQRSTSTIAAELSERIGRRVTAEEVETIVDRKLAPLGILMPDGLPMPGFEMGGAVAFEPPPSVAPDAALGIMGRLPLVPARFFEPLANAVKHLYSPWLAVPILAAIAAAHVYAYTELAPALVHFSPLTMPPVALLLVLLAIQLVIPWHELGHAAAARHFGARHGPMGIGFMGMGIVAFVDVGDVWRLQRRQRLVVDLGGVYFQSMSIVVCALWAWATANPTVLWVVLAMDFAMLMNLNPLFKLDGYWAVSDATGIPNLHHRVGEQLGGFAAARLLAIGRLIRLRRLHQSRRLQAMATATGNLEGFGAAARVALWLFSALFVLSAAYFLLFLVLIVPMIALSYPLYVMMSIAGVHAALTGNGDGGIAFMMVLQTFFATLLLLNLALAAKSLIRAAYQRRRRGFQLGGFGGFEGFGGGRAMQG
jgi:hypothetical protein